LAIPITRSKTKKSGGILMKKHVTTINKNSLAQTVKTGGCGECQTSCQSACKTSCTVGNQVCRKKT
jgi:predicted ribosomally synthesized six-cysteine peptide SCIFF